MCSDCRHFDTAVKASSWCKLLCVPLHEAAEPCSMFEAKNMCRKEPVIPVVSAIIRKATTNKPKKETTHVRIKCFAD